MSNVRMLYKILTKVKRERKKVSVKCVLVAFFS